MVSFFSSFFFSLISLISRWTSSLPSCLLWSQRIFPSLPGSRLTIFYRDASSALLQLVQPMVEFYLHSRSHAFRYERKNTNPTLERIELTTSALAGVQITYYETTRATRAKQVKLTFPCPRPRLRIGQLAHSPHTQSESDWLILTVLTHGIPPAFHDGVHLHR